MSLESKITEDFTENYEIIPEEMRVLVVDSDPTCLAIVSKILRLCGYEVWTAKYADEALSIAKKRKDDLHLVLMEVHLPDMNKYELIEKMAEVSRLPIVIMSSDENEKGMLGGLFKGAMLYLVKPITMSDIRNLWQFPFMKRVAERTTATEKFPSMSKYRKAKRDRERAGEVADSGAIKRRKLVWTDELHNKFLKAVNEFGIDRAHPKEILHHMNVPGIRKDNISSHLQKYRLYLKRRPAGSKVLADFSKSSLISSSRPPLTLNLQETSAQSSNHPEMTTAESFISIPHLFSDAFPHPHRPLTLSLQETSAQSSSQPEMTTAESFVSIPPLSSDTFPHPHPHPHLDPLPQTTPISSFFFDYEDDAEFSQIGGFYGEKTYSDGNIFDMENYSTQKLREEEEFPELPQPPSLNEEMQPALPLYRPLMEEEEDEREKVNFPPPLVMSPNQNEEENIFEISSKQIDDLDDVFGFAKGSALSFHDEDLDELW